jgi:orotate phosphoribosyltransferase
MSVDLGQLLESSGAILKGHFLLASGRHSDVYFEKFRILEQPKVLSALCTEIANHYKDSGIQYVAGPTTGGIIIAFEVARQMGLPSIYVESENGTKTLRRNKTIPEGARVLLVDDVLTTGSSLFESRTAIEGAGGVVVGYGVLIDRSAHGTDFKLPLFGAYKVEAQTFPPNQVPDWLSAIPLVKPGTSAKP